MLAKLGYRIIFLRFLIVFLLVFYDIIVLLVFFKEVTVQNWEVFLSGLVVHFLDIALRKSQLLLKFVICEVYNEFFNLLGFVDG